MGKRQQKTKIKPRIRKEKPGKPGPKGNRKTTTPKNAASKNATTQINASRNSASQIIASKNALSKSAAEKRAASKTIASKRVAKNIASRSTGKGSPASKSVPKANPKFFKGHPSQYTVQDMNEAIELIHGGMTVIDAALKFGIPRATVFNRSRDGCKTHSGRCSEVFAKTHGTEFVLKKRTKMMQYTKEMVQRAIDDVHVGMPVIDAAILHDIPRATLFIRSGRGCPSHPGRCSTVVSRGKPRRTHNNSRYRYLNIIQKKQESMHAGETAAPPTSGEPEGPADNAQEATPHLAGDSTSTVIPNVLVNENALASLDGGAAQPVVSAASPVEGHAQHIERRADSVVGHAQPVKGIAQPVGLVLGHARLVVGHVQPVMGHAQLILGHAQTVLGHAQPVECHSQPVLGHAQLVLDHSQAVEGHAQPVLGHAQPVEGHAQPVEAISQPVLGHAQPVLGHTQPVEGGSQPVLGHAQPVLGHAQPAEGGAQPGGAQESQPVPAPAHGTIKREDTRAQPFFPAKSLTSGPVVKLERSSNEDYYS